MTYTRRSFIKTAAAAAMATAAGRLCADGAAPAKRWYKGNLHMHSFWSDGRAFPEQALGWYKSHGYNFCGLTDHNVFADNGARWKKASDVAKNVLAEYLAHFPSAEKRTVKGRDEYRLKTFAEYSALLNEKEKFLVLPGVEDTRHVAYAKSGEGHAVHMNYINLPGLPPEMQKGFKAGVKDVPLADFVRDNRAFVERYAKKTGRPHLFMLNHPIWTWYDIPPEVLIDNPEVRFFEQCNNGSPKASPVGFPADGLDTDRFWDVVNAFRARRNQPLLYGVGNDDTHYYHGEGGDMLMPGNAWNLVRADALTPEALIAAFEAGDSVVCEGVEPSDVAFDGGTGRLTVRVAAKKGLARTVRFIVSKRDFSERPEATVAVTPPGASEKDRKTFARVFKVYDRQKVGIVAKTAKGVAGAELVASYTLQPDDLYVRARIESPGTPLCTAHLHPRLHVAWTQPYRI